MKITIWQKWIIYCGLGEFIGMGTVALVAVMTTKWIGEPMSSSQKLITLMLMLLAGVVEGLILGALQWQIIKKIFVRITALEWVGYTVLAAVMGWMLGMTPSLLQPIGDTANEGFDPPQYMMILVGIGMGLVLGALFGLLQRIPLVGQTTKANSWILANMLGWGVAIGIIFIGSTSTAADWSIGTILSIGAITGLIAGISFGAITAWFLKRMTIIL